MYLCVWLKEREIYNKSHSGIIWIAPLSCLLIIHYGQSVIIAFVLCNSPLCYCVTRAVSQLESCNLGIGVLVFFKNVCLHASLSVSVCIFVQVLPAAVRPRGANTDRSRNQELHLSSRWWQRWQNWSGGSVSDFLTCICTNSWFRQKWPHWLD